ncbi:hypothetical protein [Paenibacillus pabuli]|uniref:hypothetical protein n=1 Tax=Paenibacillus pabuli TaxID=1472 RepID=UPI003CF59FE2
MDANEMQKYYDLRHMNSGKSIEKYTCGKNFEISLHEKFTTEILQSCSSLRFRYPFMFSPALLRPGIKGRTTDKDGRRRT